MLHESQLDVLVYLFAIFGGLCALYALLGGAAQYLQFRAFYREANDNAKALAEDIAMAGLDHSSARRSDLDVRDLSDVRLVRAGQKARARN